MLLETNGSISSSKITKHIKARCFLITDNIEKGDPEIEYFPIEKYGQTFWLNQKKSRLVVYLGGNEWRFQSIMMIPLKGKTKIQRF